MPDVDGCKCQFNAKKMHSNNSVQNAKMSIDPKFVELMADVLKIVLSKTQPTKRQQCRVPA